MKLSFNDPTHKKMHTDDFNSENSKFAASNDYNISSLWSSWWWSVTIVKTQTWRTKKWWWSLSIAIPTVPSSPALVATPWLFLRTILRMPLFSMSPPLMLMGWVQHTRNISRFEITVRSRSQMRISYVWSRYFWSSTSMFIWSVNLAHRLFRLVLTQVFTFAHLWASGLFNLLQGLFIVLSLSVGLSFGLPLGCFCCVLVEFCNILIMIDNINSVPKFWNVDEGKTFYFPRVYAGFH